MKKIYYLLIFLLCTTSYCFAQNLTIQGRVTDKETGEVLIGTTVMEKGTTNVTSTDLNGNFTINVANESSLLEISYISYITAEVAANGNLNIELMPDTNTLEEIVVVGYGTIRKSDVTGAVAKINSDDLAKITSVDATQALQGKAAGVNVQLNSGEPGSGTKIRIRGVGSINNSDPLYVVDGIQMSNISHISPTNIASIEVLKDASATAIYGSRGSNGVVMIKTRSGSKGMAPVLSANISATMSQITDQIDMVNASEYAVIKMEALNNSGSPISDVHQNLFNYVIDNNLKGTNWQDEIFRTAYTKNYDINIVGGTEKSTYNVGATYSNEEGVVKETFLDKFMAHVNNEYSFTDNIKLGLNIYYTHFDRTGNNSDYYSGPLVGALRADPISSAWDPYTNNFGEIYYAYGSNPARAVDENKYKSEMGNSLVVNSFLQFDNLVGLNGLSFRAQFGADMSWKKVKNYYPIYYITENQQRIQSALYEKSDNSFNWTTSEYFSYSNNFNKHSINATLGFEASQFKYSYLDITAYDVPADTNLQYISASTNKNQYLANGIMNTSTLASVFARANYSYDNRYLFTATVRADGSSKFVDKWGYFPSFSLGWNIYNEAFMQYVQGTVSQLKFRGGWGQVGNQNAAGNNDYLSTMVSGYSYVFGGQPYDGSIQEKVANKLLSWEASEQYNVGVDFGLWNNLLTGTVDYYVRNTNNMILATPIPMYSGFWKPNTNAGSISNKGFELTLNHSNSINDFSYNIGFNLSTINNEVTSIGGGDPIEGGTITRVGNATRTEVGHEIAYYYGLKTDGIFNSQEEVDTYLNEDGNKIQPSAAPGDVKFVDINGDGKIDESTDRTKLGSAIPELTYGINLTMAYKAFDFNMALQGVYGNELVNGMYYTLYSTDMSEWSVCKDMLNRWTPNNPDSNIPRVNAADPNKNGKFSDLYVEDGSYLRISNLQLGYTLPERFAEKIKMSQLRVYLSANNIHTFTKYSGFDPEVAGSDLSSGVDVANYPIPKSFSFGLNIKF